MVIAEDLHESVAQRGSHPSSTSSFVLPYVFHGDFNVCSDHREQFGFGGNGSIDEARAGAVHRIGLFWFICDFGAKPFTSGARTVKKSSTIVLLYEDLPAGSSSVFAFFGYFNFYRHALSVCLP